MKMNNVFFLICFLSIALSPGLNSKEIKIGSKKVVRSVKDILKAGKIETSKTCLDEYVQRNRQLWKKMGFGALKTLGGSAGAGAGVGVGLFMKVVESDVVPYSAFTEKVPLCPIRVVATSTDVEKFPAPDSDNSL